MSAAQLLGWLADLPADARDRAVEAHLGIDAGWCSDAPPGEGLVGYHASAVSAVVRALCEVPLDGDDVFIDLGAGLGKVAFLVALLTPARVRGIEVQAALVQAATHAASALGLDGRVTFDEDDARDADLANGTVFFLYAPFTGEVLDAVLLRLRAVAETHAIVVVALGIDLGRASAWLVARPLDAFWLAIYDSALSASASRQRPRPRTGATLGVRLAGTDAEVIAFGRERAG